MTPLLGIHHRSGSFSDAWLCYCTRHSIPHVILDGFSNDISKRLKSVDGFLWNWYHGNPHEVLFARHVIASAECVGIPVYPNTATSWHYDDKVAQKQLLETIGAPLVPSYVFHDRGSAIRWAETTDFPKVFKLRRGAGGSNVRLVSGAREAIGLINRAFRSGYKPVSHASSRSGKASPFNPFGSSASRNRPSYFIRLRNVLRKHVRTLQANRMLGHECGYVLFQDFIPGLERDTRVVVIGERIMAYSRLVAPGDFRASGSGLFQCDPKTINVEMLRQALSITKAIGAQSLAFDFVDDGASPRLLEISYTFGTVGLRKVCTGYFTSDMVWHSQPPTPEEFIIEDFISEIVRKKSGEEGAR